MQDRALKCFLWVHFVLALMYIQYVFVSKSWDCCLFYCLQNERFKLALPILFTGCSFLLNCVCFPHALRKNFLHLRLNEAKMAASSVTTSGSLLSFEDYSFYSNLSDEELIHLAIERKPEWHSSICSFWQSNWDICQPMCELCPQKPNSSSSAECSTTSQPTLVSLESTDYI